MSFLDDLKKLAGGAEHAVQQVAGPVSQIFHQDGGHAAPPAQPVNILERLRGNASLAPTPKPDYLYKFNFSDPRYRIGEGDQRVIPYSLEWPGHVSPPTPQNQVDNGWLSPQIPASDKGIYGHPKPPAGWTYGPVGGNNLEGHPLKGWRDQGGVPASLPHGVPLMQAYPNFNNERPLRIQI